MAKILITGATGLVGLHLSRMLRAAGHEVVHLSRSASSGTTFQTFKWDVGSEWIDEKAFEGVTDVIHLAGAGIADSRWSAGRKQEIIDSRVLSTRLLHGYISKLQIRLRSFISASAIGYYGMSTGDQFLEEDHPAGSDFLAYVVKLWEAEADKMQNLTSVAKIRIGVVLSPEGGAMKQMGQPIKWGIGAPLASGQQYMSWIHIQDLCRLFVYVLENELQGVYNAVAPDPVSNETLTRAMAKAWHRPLFLPRVPAFMLKLLLGEMADMVIGGNRVSSRRIQAAGYQFKFPELPSAMKDLLGE